MAKYRINVSFDGENYFWIVVDNGKFIRNPNKKDLMGTKLIYYNPTNVCPICREYKEINGIEFTDKNILYSRNACKEKDKNGKKTDRYICARHYAVYRRRLLDSHNNIMKFLGDRRINNQDPNSPNYLGDESQELACKLNGWGDLNKKYDNYISPLDCYDPKTELYHQVQRHSYSSAYKLWHFTNFEREWRKRYEDMICICYSKDGKIVERIYIFPKKEIDRITSISIYKNPTRGRYATPFTPWYEQYRVTDESELKKANDIWKQILEKKKIKKVIKFSSYRTCK